MDDAGTMTSVASILDASVKTEPGWYPDPALPGQERYWDGQDWTPRTQVTTPRPPIGRDIT